MTLIGKEVLCEDPYQEEPLVIQQYNIRTLRTLYQEGPLVSCKVTEHLLLLREQSDPSLPTLESQNIINRNPDSRPNIFRCIEDDGVFATLWWNCSCWKDEWSQCFVSSIQSTLQVYNVLNHKQYNYILCISWLYPQNNTNTYRVSQEKYPLECF